MYVEPSESGGGRTAQLQIESGGVSALLVTKQITLDLNNLLQEMRTMTRRSLANFSSTWHVLHQQMDAMHSSTLFDSAKPPNGMILLPRARFNFSVSGTALEGGCAPEDDPNGICCRSKLCTGDGSPDCQCAIVGDEYFGAPGCAVSLGEPAAAESFEDLGFGTFVDRSRPGVRGHQEHTTMNWYGLHHNIHTGKVPNFRYQPVRFNEIAYNCSLYSLLKEGCVHGYIWSSVPHYPISSPNDSP
eukprot:s580_g26.t1